LDKAKTIATIREPNYKYANKTSHAYLKKYKLTNMKILNSSQQNWKRYWCKLDELVTLDDSGFLFDPETKETFYKKTDVVSFSKISNLNCLVLLGEPGIGKSTALRNEFLHRKKYRKSSEVYIFKDLNEYGDENRLIKEVFNSQEFNGWLKSNVCSKLEDYFKY